MSKIKSVFSHFGKFCINAQNHNADIVDFAYIVSLNEKSAECICGFEFSFRHQEILSD